MDILAESRLTRIEQKIATIALAIDELANTGEALADALVALRCRVEELEELEETLEPGAPIAKIALVRRDTERDLRAVCEEEPPTVRINDPRSEPPPKPTLHMAACSRCRAPVQITGRESEHVLCRHCAGER